ncbi:ankyrin repeat and sam domain containing protein 6 [Colletotrichum kahawae]|uniref:Ankyrin repeat and sam domain containing protein 6 n=1 Tax=Colletotrichum kahawae TaxID=34407 RepID=A0AAE0D3B1_COLKA|nr:ankyrin repeat and sam domain containing protein 6 [Colletotrichum kahawae]
MENQPLDTTTRPYQYEPLNHDQLEFRLLHLLPANDPTEPLSCRLEIASGRTRPQFETLSYTWGGEAPCEPLLVNETHLLNVTPNLASFLQQRRDPIAEVIIWVDAVCINQNDVAEKNQQVSVMTVLYIASHAITIWLGPAADNSDAAMEELEVLSRSTVYSRMPSVSSKTAAAIGKLLNRPWWTRVWIVQEVCWGAVGGKLMTATVRCGSRSISWHDIVLACGRIKVHETSLRQSISHVESVLHLESVRWSGEHIYTKGNTTGFDENDFLQLVSKYRHFDATDPRDKIYALLGLLRSRPGLDTRQLRVDYGIDAEELYRRFTIITAVRAPGLGILQHCSWPSDDYSSGRPSWVPNWSRKRRETPLPNRASEIKEEIPWWAVPQKTGDTIVYPTTHGKAQDMAQETLEDTRGVAVAQSQAELLSELPPDARNTIQDLMRQGEVLLASLPSEPRIDAGIQTSISEIFDRIMTSNERITQRSFLRDWLDETKEKRPPYSAGTTQTTSSTPTFSEDLKSMTVDGIIWDTIKSTHEPFPEDLDSTWEASTHFMVDVAQCKSMVMIENHDLNPYGSEDARNSAFWDALFAGQVVDLSTRPDDWLPHLPPAWSSANPPLTSTKPGQVELAEISEIVDKEKSERTRVAGEDTDWRAVEFEEAFDPQHWTEAERIQKTERFQELAKLWHSQPYDLYHRHFKLPAVVPDAYWTCRVRDDKRARTLSAASRCKKWINGIIGPDEQSTRRMRTQALKTFGETPSMIPQETVDFPVEKYALGRQFFVTTRGYLGIGPANTHAGDHVAILITSQVPFILRGCMDNGYRILGEAYVSGGMNGEVIDVLVRDEQALDRIKLV